MLYRLTIMKIFNYEGRVQLPQKPVFIITIHTHIYVYKQSTSQLSGCEQSHEFLLFYVVKYIFSYSSFVTIFLGLVIDLSVINK